MFFSLWLQPGKMIIFILNLAHILFITCMKFKDHILKEERLLFNIIAGFLMIMCVVFLILCQTKVENA